MRKSLSQASQRMSQATPRSQVSPMATGDLMGLARAAVRYLLMNDFDKVPIKHTDIVKNVTKGASKNTNQVMQAAGKILEEVYGIKLEDDGEPSQKKTYYLINNVKYQEHISLSETCQQEQSLLAIVLSLIFMKTNGRPTQMGLKQEELLHFLKSIDLDVTQMHPDFGDIKKTLEMFKSQRYLNLIRIENTDPPKYEYRWGARAVYEVSPRDTLIFATEMYGREDITTWAAHYKAVLEDEQKGRL